ncbi:MAG: MATE family efflux transporter, partial [Eubacteriales bacterium]|nr:MATE family efflux transporter [Eubacteriales bacterium]
MTKEIRGKNQITEGVIWKQLLIFFFPIAVGTIFQQFYNVVDAVIVGRFVGKQALASVGGSAAVLSSMVIAFFSGLASGASVIISQYYGARDSEGLHRGIHTAYAFSIMLSVVLAVAGWLLTPWLLTIMNTPADVMADSVTYLRIYFLGLIATLTYNMGSSIMRAVGDSKRPLYYLIVCSICNIILDILLVVVFRMGIAGASIATVISQAVSAILVTRSLMTSYDGLKLRLRSIRIDFRTLKSELRIGLPGGLQFCISGITNIIIQAAINGFGTDTAAAWGAFNKIDMIYWTVCSALGASVTTFVGQNYGAKKMDRVYKSVRTCLLMAFVMCESLQIFMILLRHPLVSIFTTDTSVIEIGGYMILILIPTYIICVFSEIPAGALRGMGDALVPTVINMIGLCGVRLPWLLFILPSRHKLITLLLSYPVSGSVSTVLMIGYYFVQ